MHHCINITNKSFQPQNYSVGYTLVAADRGWLTLGRDISHMQVN